MIYFELVALSFFVIACILIGFMLIYLKRIKNKRAKYNKWKNIADLLIRDAIFSEDESIDTVRFNIEQSTNVLVENFNFRKILTKDILSAKKNMSGKSSIFLQKLYLQLGLDQYAIKNISSKRWHIKTKAIQDLGIMGLKENLSKIYRYTNNTNELIRMEAQIAVIKLTGFEGLRFLDVINTPINDWQQIKLLNELSHVQANDFSGIEKWLHSANESVVVFALKLVRVFRRLELYKQVELCLLHQSPSVRKEAILAIEKIYTEYTAKVLLSRYEYEVIENQITILKVIQQIGDEETIDTLISFIDSAANEEKRTIVRAIAHISINGLAQLSLLPDSKRAPLSLIIKQIEGEINA